MPIWLIVCQTALIILTLLLAPISIWMVIAVFIGFFKQKELDVKTVKNYNFSILICARNEENVIENLINSLKEQDYCGNFRIFVVADNCEDNTAGIARLNGAIVFERSDLDNIGKGYAMKYGVNRILEHSPDTEAVCVFDADNLVSPAFLTEMNKGFNAGAQVVSGFRDSKNIRQSWVSEVYCVYWYMLMRFYYAPRRKLKLSTLVGGTGFAFLVNCLDGKGWHTETMTEDIEFSIQQILANHKILYVDTAIFYDEQPTAFSDSMKQRSRWITGCVQCLRLYAKKVFSGIIDGRKKLWDTLWYLFFIPSAGLSLIMEVLSIIVVCSTPFIKEYAPVLISAATVFSLIIMWFMAFVSAKSYKGKAKSLFKGILMYPIFIYTMMGISLVTIFKQNNEWTPIKHSDISTIQQIEEERQN